MTESRKRRRAGMIARVMVAARLLGKRIVSGENSGGLLGDFVMGALGAIMGAWIFGLSGHVRVTGLDLTSIFAAFIGTLALLWIIRVIAAPRARA
jgi:uncharacterized membrane protein YeaQ/YmgE (transglycosylase-associated protein family)